jgi:hypothetical protein
MLEGEVIDRLEPALLSDEAPAPPCRVRSSLIVMSIEPGGCVELEPHEINPIQIAAGRCTAQGLGTFYIEKGEDGITRCFRID